MILDAGSGHNPLSQADVLCDLFLGPTLHRGHLAHEPAKLDERPFVCCDLQALPFKLNAFTFVYCGHVLEHVDDPNLVLTELKRIGIHGIALFPSQLWERFFHSCKGHKWAIIPQNKKCLAKNVKTGIGGLIRCYSSSFFNINFRIQGRKRLIGLFQRIFKWNIYESAIRW